MTLKILHPKERVPITTLILRVMRPEVFQRPRVRRALLLLATACLVGGLAAALRQHPDLLRNLRWSPVLFLLFAAIPITVVINAVEFVLIGRMVQQRIPLTQALEISILGTVANMLPFPGGMLVRVAALKAGGSGYSNGTAATLLAALIWIGVSFAYAGVWITMQSSGWLGAFFVLGGGIALAASSIIATKLNFGAQSVLGIFLVRLSLVLIDAIRLYLCLMALDAGASFAQASSFAAAGAVGSSISIVPSGLGVREAVTAALAPVVGIAAAIGFLAATLNRVLEIPVLVPLALLLNLGARFTRTTAAPSQP